MSTTGKRIKQRRKAKGISPAELARRIGTDRQRVDNWERNENKPRDEILEKLAAELGVSPEWIIFAREAQHPALGASASAAQLNDLRQHMLTALGELTTALKRLDRL